MKEFAIKVFISHRDSVCAECGEELMKGWITLDKQKGALCLECSDLDHLLFLPTGDAALTVRTSKYSKLIAVVLKWSRARKRYERQGLLVEEEALKKAEVESLSDQEGRERRREREAVRREELDRNYVATFANRIRELFPKCPSGKEIEIAEHACLRKSGRVGRSAGAKTLDADFVRLAVIANIRHTETKYHDLLSTGVDRVDARRLVHSDVEKILRAWENR